MRTIAIIVGACNGVSFHRQIIPHIHLANKYKDEFEVLIKDGVQEITDEEWKRINLIQFSGYFDFQKEDIFRRKGIVVVLDKDDYWDLPKNHIRKYEWELNKIWYRTELSIAAADHITCTTSHLANEISELNKNITIIPNSINHRMAMYHPVEWNVNPEFIRFGGLWGTSHIHDLELLRENIKKMDEQKDLRGRFQIIMGGISMTETERYVIAGKNGQQKKIKLPPYETVWGRMERSLTNDYYMLRGMNEYLKYLAQYTETEIERMEGKVYKRIWGRDLFNYCRGYNEMDVVLAPVINDKFNSCKSQLKLIEAGYFGRPVICSQVAPYMIDGIDGQNCFMVKESRPLDWYIRMRQFIKQPELIKEMGAMLRQVIMKNYLMDKVNETRAELYRHLIDKK